MKNVINIVAENILILGMLLFSFSDSYAEAFELNPLNEGYSIIKFDGSKNVLMLPIQESVSDVRVEVIENNNLLNVQNIRLAIDSIDYYLPMKVSKDIVLFVDKVKESAIYWKSLKCLDKYEVAEFDKFRNVYHHTPLYGWMNDPNGMYYKDGVYHLFYQYNPYCAIWANMHWGHSVSTDLVNWEHKDIAIAPDGHGYIFSGSCVVDKNNTAGYGKNAVIAYYTSEKQGTQSQSLSYSLDNGETFTSAKGNPQLIVTDLDSRDPKIFWYEATQRWIMVLACGQQIKIFSSADLNNWDYESAFGQGEGNHVGAWECPDLFNLPVEGTTETKWVLSCNCDGGPFGGPATQYFVGNFDGHKFISDNPKKTKWMDYGRDHYATVTWSNVPDGRCLAMAWMSNLRYSSLVPTHGYRSANSLVRELSLFKEGNDDYIICRPAREIDKYLVKSYRKRNLSVGNEYSVKNFIKENKGAYEIKIDFNKFEGSEFSFDLRSKSGDVVKFRYDAETQYFYFDRTKSGIVDFSDQFPCVTFTKTHGELKNLRIFVDRSSVEIFGNDGKFVMTNIVFPENILTDLYLYSKDGKTRLSKLEINNIMVK